MGMLYEYSGLPYVRGDPHEEELFLHRVATKKRKAEQEDGSSKGDPTKKRKTDGSLKPPPQATGEASRPHTVLWSDSSSRCRKVSCKS
jgi:hypothetical protein